MGAGDSLASAAALYSDPYAENGRLFTGGSGPRI